MRTLLIAAMLLMCSQSFGAIDWNDHKLHWHGYEDGLLELKKGNKNGLLIIYAEWCSVCKRYSAMFHDAEVVRQAENVVLIRLDQDKDTAYAKAFAHDGDYVPRTFILSSDGTVQPSPYKTQKYMFYLPPDSNQYLVEILKYLSIDRQNP